MKIKVCHLMQINLAYDIRVLLKVCKSPAEPGYHGTLITLKDQEMNIDHGGIEVRIKQVKTAVVLTPGKVFKGLDLKSYDG